MVHPCSEQLMLVLFFFFFLFSPARILFRSTSAGGAVGAAVRKCE